MKYNALFKFIAIMLCAAALLAAAGAAFGVFGLASMELYEMDVQTYRANQLYYRAESAAYAVAERYSAIHLGGCPEEVAAHYYYGSFRYFDEIEFGELSYTLLDAEDNLLESSGEPVPGGFSFDIEIQSLRYLHFLEEIVPETMEETITTAPDVYAPVPGEEATEPVLQTTVPTEPGEEGFVYAFFDTRTNTHREFLMRHEEAPGYTVQVSIAPAEEGNQQLWQLLELLWQYRMELFWVIGGGLTLFGILAVYLCFAAAHKPGREELRAGGLNRLPLDGYLVLVILGCTVLVLVAVEGGEYLLRQNLWPAMILVTLCGYGCALMAVCFCFAAAAQLKTPGGFWYRNSLFGWCFKLVVLLWGLACRILAWCFEITKKLLIWCWRLFREKLVPLALRCLKALLKLLRFFWDRLGKLLHWAWTQLKRVCTWVLKKIARFVSLLPLTWQWLLASFLMILILALTVNSYRSGMVLLGLGLTLALVLYGTSAFGTLLESAKRMRRGDLDTKVDETFLIGCFRDFAQELNGLADVAVVAAQKQLKSERMKTELITNVSHDIKTPLTSIINYVDLMQKPHTSEEQEMYLEVLNRQSQRLKKLIDDLMEMSKASTGNLTVEIGVVDACESVNQALGEFSDKLEKAQLHPVFHRGEEQIFMLADGKLVWRVMSNLLSNAVKYALPGTRVYLDVTAVDGKVFISMKNISREELNVQADELMERFVRGDASRNTEGSGLGLNIARSLMELQKGQLQLLVDGDLFKVTLIFPEAK